MSTPRRTACSTLLALLAFATAGCMSWTPGWTAAVHPVAPPASAPDVATRLDAADRLFEATASRSDLLAAIAAYRGILEYQPNNYRALTRLGEAHILLGAAYAPDRRAKAAAYRAGIQWCERALATHPEFARLATTGGIAAAAPAITAREYEAAYFWITGVSYYFKECLRGPAILWHLDWMRQTEHVLERLEAIDPDWGPGMLQFSLAIFRLGMPARYGGDMTASARHFDRALELAPDSLLMRWGRARYFHAKRRDPVSARADLEQVIAMDPDRATSPRRWNLYFQRDAREQLERIDRRR